MLLFPETRTELGNLVTEILSPNWSTVTVYPSGLESLAEMPCVVLGQPNWTPTGPTQGVNNEYVWPIAVVLERPGEPSPETVDVLDGLWSTLLRGLVEASAADSTLGGICRQSIVANCTFAPFTVQGQDYPAQQIILNLYT